MQNEKCRMKNAGKNAFAGISRCFQFYILHFEFLILSTSPPCALHELLRKVRFVQGLFLVVSCPGNQMN